MSQTWVHVLCLSHPGPTSCQTAWLKPHPKLHPSRMASLWLQWCLLSALQIMDINKNQDIIAEALIKYIGIIVDETLEKVG